MYVAALNKTKLEKSDYSHAINTIEDVGVSAIAADIRAACSSTLQVIEKKAFTIPSGEIITPDIVILGVEEALIIDVKYASPPLTSRDVARDLAEMDKWHTRMGEYVRLRSTRESCRNISRYLTHSWMRLGCLASSWFDGRCQFQLSLRVLSAV